jgi:hypothetical protein
VCRTPVLRRPTQWACYFEDRRRPWANYSGIAFLFLLTWDLHSLHNTMVDRRPQDEGSRRPFAEWPELVPGMGGGWKLHRTARDSLAVVCCGKHQPPKPVPSNQKMLMSLLGFLWALLFLAAFIRWTDPTCCARMFRFVRRPVLVPIRRPAQRLLSSALPWWFYPIMAPPEAEPTQCRRSYPFRRS